MSLKYLALAALALVAVKPVSPLIVPPNTSDSTTPSLISPPQNPLSFSLPLNLSLTRRGWKDWGRLGPLPETEIPGEHFVCRSAPGNPICETSSASPTVEDVKSLIDYFRSAPNKVCYPSHQTGSKCQTMHRNGLSGVSVCIKPGMYRAPFKGYEKARMDFGWFPCYSVVAYLEGLIASCAEYGKVGGMTRMPCYFEQYIVLHM